MRYIRFRLLLNYPGTWYPKLAYYLLESFPGITLFLTPTIHPREDDTHGTVVKVSQTFRVPAYPIIVEISSQFRPEVLHEMIHPPPEVGLTPFGHVPQ
jgi:hypothetical protein